METTIQIIVAGALLLAWIWVLGRPLVAPQGRSRLVGGTASYQDHVAPPVEQAADGSDLLDFRPSRGRRILEAWKSWLHRPAEVWRRQLLLASMLAVFASFLLAIALRNDFLLLFGLMMIGLAIHLLLAVFVGSRMVAADRAVAVAAAKRKVAAPGILIRAAPVADLSAGSESAPVAADESVQAPEDDTSESAFDLAAEMASELDGAEVTEPVDEAALVSDLIESEWGGSIEAGSEAGADNSDGASPQDGDESTDSGSGSAGEPIFRRAAKDEPTRSKRTAEAIYIESQLDETGDVPEAKVVNHP